MNATIMSPQLLSTSQSQGRDFAKEAQIRENQRHSWDTFSPGWAQWDDFTMRFLAPQGRAIVEALSPAPGAQLLDIATGTGEPASSLAQATPGGRVIGLDLSEGMLRVAEAKAIQRGISNLETRVGSADALDFDDDSFDAISCRLGFMFFPNPAAAAEEIFRVLKPGGTFATTVWAEPADNAWITTVLGAMKAHIDLPTPPPGGPGLFRFANPEPLCEALEAAGFELEQQRRLAAPMRCVSFEEYWGFMRAVVPPVVAALKDADASLVSAIEETLRERLVENAEGGYALPSEVHLLVLRK